MKKFLLSAALVWAGLAAQAQDCPALTELNENFTNFTAGRTATFPQFCWTAIANGPMVYPDVTGENKFAQFYASMSPGVAGYLVSPAISNFDGNHTLTFDATSATGVTVQAGYLTNATDATTFVAVSEVLTLTATTAAITVNFPVVSGNANIAFKFIGATAHNTAQVDNIVWNETPAAPCVAVSEFSEDFSDYETGQTKPINQFCWTGIATGAPTGVYVYPDTVAENAVAQFYNFMNPAVAGYLVSPEVNSFDGNHTLTFSAGSGTSSTGTIQVGYLTNAADATTFVEVGDAITIPAAATPFTREFPTLANNAYIAFKFLIPNVPHQTAYVDNIAWTENPVAECEAVAELNEDFSTFTTGVAALPQNCWSGITTATTVYLVAQNGDNKAQFYSGSAVGQPGYLVTPEINSFDGNHTLTFDAASATGVALQPGYLTNGTDASTFVAVGSAITLAAAPATTYNVANFPAVTGGAHIAFQFTAAGEHNTATVDNVKWQATASVGTNNKSIFAVYPNPSSNKNITIANATQQDGAVAIYTLAGAKVFEAKVSGAAQQLNLSALSAGMYVVRFTSGNAAATQKLILQ